MKPNLIPGKLYLFKSNSSFFDDMIGMFIKTKIQYHKEKFEGIFFIILYEDAIEKLCVSFYVPKELI